MPAKPVIDAALLKIMVTQYKDGLTMRQICKRHTLGYGTVQLALKKAGVETRPSCTRTKEAVKQAPPVAGAVHARSTLTGWAPGKVQRYLLTCAQNNTHLHDQVWANMNSLAKHYDARLLVARTVYNRFARAADTDKKLAIDAAREAGAREYWWDERLHPFFHDERLQLATGLVWCGETNIMPTAVNPLAGFDSYTARASSIFPGPRVAMRSIPTMPDEGTKLMFTTGTVTQRNYIQRKAGQLAEFHHTYGGLLVEVDGDGTWFCRQVIASDDGVLNDWDVTVDEHGHVSTGNSLEAINWGDIHVAYGDPVTYKLAWGEGGLLDELRPRYQFMHDLVDFRARNWHNVAQNRNVRAFIEYGEGHRSVEEEMLVTAKFLAQATRPEVQTVVVDSNHDNFFVNWLERDGDFRKDHINAVYFLEAALHLWSEAKRTGEAPNMTRWAMERAVAKVGGVLNAKFSCFAHPLRFLDEDESFLICGDLECGLHGHERFNGARGGPAAFSRIGRKINAGHVHSSGIWDGAWFAGIIGSLKQGYNSGLGSWSQTNIFTYKNGKRAMQTFYDGKARVT